VGLARQLRTHPVAIAIATDFLLVPALPALLTQPDMPR